MRRRQAAPTVIPCGPTAMLAMSPAHRPEAVAFSTRPLCRWGQPRARRPPALGGRPSRAPCPLEYEWSRSRAPQLIRERLRSLRRRHRAGYRATSLRVRGEIWLGSLRPNEACDCHWRSCSRCVMKREQRVSVRDCLVMGCQRRGKDRGDAQLHFRMLALAT
jgi:hypothetical protein